MAWPKPQPLLSGLQGLLQAIILGEHGAADRPEPGRSRLVLLGAHELVLGRGEVAQVGEQHGPQEPHVGLQIWFEALRGEPSESLERSVGPPLLVHMMHMMVGHPWVLGRGPIGPQPEQRRGSRRAHPPQYARAEHAGLRRLPGERITDRTRPPVRLHEQVLLVQRQDLGALGRARLDSGA